MKPKKEHKKGQESTIGKIIYGFLLFMPLIAILSTILYTSFNKNAYESYYGETINESTTHYVELNELEQGKTYTYVIANTIYTDSDYTQSRIIVSNVIDNANSFGTYGAPDYPISEVTNITFRNYNNSSLLIELKKANEQIGYYILSTGVNITFEFNELSLLGNNYSLVGDFTYVTYNNLSYLSDSFYYAVDKVTESPLFNWAENSVIYTTMNATCTQLSITTPFIPLLLSYWLIISVIYFLYDIALMLIWAIHDRIHEMKESIS